MDTKHVIDAATPLGDGSDPVYQAGLRLEHIDTRIVPCPYAQSFEEHGDIARFAEEYIPTIRTRNESIYLNGRSAERPLEQRREIIEAYCDFIREVFIPSSL